MWLLALNRIVTLGHAHGLRFGGGPARFRARAAARCASGDTACVAARLEGPLLDVAVNAAGPAFTVRDGNTGTVELVLHLPKEASGHEWVVGVWVGATMAPIAPMIQWGARASGARNRPYGTYLELRIIRGSILASYADGAGGWGDAL